MYEAIQFAADLAELLNDSLAVDRGARYVLTVTDTAGNAAEVEWNHRDPDAPRVEEWTSAEDVDVRRLRMRLRMDRDKAAAHDLTTTPPIGERVGAALDTPTAARAAELTAAERAALDRLRDCTTVVLAARGPALTAHLRGELYEALVAFAEAAASGE